jgi:hypothetical protein
MGQVQPICPFTDTFVCKWQKSLLKHAFEATVPSHTFEATVRSNSLRKHAFEASALDITAQAWIRRSHPKHVFAATARSKSQFRCGPVPRAAVVAQKKALSKSLFQPFFSFPVKWEGRTDQLELR